MSDSAVRPGDTRTISRSSKNRFLASVHDEVNPVQRVNEELIVERCRLSWTARNELMPPPVRPSLATGRRRPGLSWMTADGQQARR